MQLTASALQSIFPATPRTRIEAIVEPLRVTSARFEITTVNRMSSFLAQVGHESGGFVHMVENLNYSAKALRSVFRKYFPTDALANAYARQPSKIASRTYGGRMGNGPEATGDGWTYRGRGFIQLTGKDNYTAFANAFGMRLIEAIVYLETSEGAMMSAGWFWDRSKLNALADAGKFDTITQRINGGQNGAADRRVKFEKARQVLAA